MATSLTEQKKGKDHSVSNQGSGRKPGRFLVGGVLILSTAIGGIGACNYIPEGPGTVGSSQLKGSECTPGAHDSFFNKGHQLVVRRVCGADGKWRSLEQPQQGQVQQGPHLRRR